MFAAFLAEGFEEVEALTPIDYLRRAGVEVVTVAVTSNDSLDNKIVKSSHGVKMMADVTLEDFMNSCAENLPDGIFFPGGLGGAKNLSQSEIISGLIKNCFEKEKLVSAICASPAMVLSPTGILKGKNWTCYPGMEEDVDPEDVEDSTHASGVPFVTDGNIVTGTAAGASEQFAVELVRIMAGEEAAEKIRKGCVLR